MILLSHEKSFHLIFSDFFLSEAKRRKFDQETIAGDLLLKLQSVKYTEYQSPVRAGKNIHKICFTSKLFNCVEKMFHRLHYMMLRKEGPLPRDLENHRDILRLYETTDNGAKELSANSLKSVADFPQKVLVQGPLDREAQCWTSGPCGVCMNGDLVTHMSRQSKQFNSGKPVDNNDLSVYWYLVGKITHIKVLNERNRFHIPHNMQATHSTSSESITYETMTCILEHPDGACILYSWGQETAKKYKVNSWKQAVSCLQSQAKEGMHLK